MPFHRALAIKIRISNEIIWLSNSAYFILMSLILAISRGAEGCESILSKESKTSFGRILVELVCYLIMLSQSHVLFLIEFLDALSTSVKILSISFFLLAT